MFKWIIGVIIILIILLLVVQPEWLKVFSAIFSDFIQANEK